MSANADLDELIRRLPPNWNFSRSKRGDEIRFYHASHRFADVEVVARTPGELVEKAWAKHPREGQLSFSFTDDQTDEPS